VCNAISIEQLSKRYWLRGDRVAYRTLRDEITAALRFPIDRLRGRVSPKQRDFWALHCVDLEVARGDVVGIIGRNGAGKSTLLKILSRITKPTNGRVTMRGRVGSLLEVGTGFHPELSGRENIFLSGAILGMTRREIARKLDQIVAFAEVERFLDTPVKRYSSGMYVRLAFSVAAHLEPDILIIDEVLAVGDAAFQKRCFGKIDEASSHGRTVVFVSHNMDAVNQFCRNVVWLEQGKVRHIGRPGDVIQSYLGDSTVTNHERTWPSVDESPGDDRVRLRGVRLLQHCKATSVVDINEPFEVAIDFQLLKDARNLITGISIYNIEQQCVFCNADWRPNQLTQGRYLKQVRIPAPLLPDGRFSLLVQLVFFDPDIPSVVCRDAILFDAIDSDHPSCVRGSYKGPWPGITRLRLDWSDATSQHHLDG
jgi:lipopolysaccharide transport system ATP-binding protein